MPSRRISIDSHCDAPSRLTEGGKGFFMADDPKAQYSFSAMEAGGVDCAFFALYTPNDMDGDAALRRSMLMLAGVRDMIRLSSGRMALVSCCDEIVSNAAKGIRSVALGLENALPIGDSLLLLDLFYAFGVRYMTLTHNGNNLVCDAAMAPSPRWGGLSPFGREVVRHMNDLGMLVDISHLSDDTVRDILELSRVPVAATHSCCRALQEHPRNLSDQLMRKLAGNGGVIQVNFYPVFLSGGECSFRRVADHIDHAVKVAGIEGVGIGTDFDGIDYAPQGLEDVSCMGVLWDELSVRGYSDDDIDRIAGGNFLRVLREVERGRKIQ